MPPQSRGAKRLGSHSKSTPNLAALNKLRTSKKGDGSVLIDSGDESSAHSSFDGDFLAPLSQKPSYASFSEEPSSLRSKHLPQRARSLASGATHSSPFYAHPSRSSSYLSTSAATFAPPFYNRPPTPLPPSPSLTSLLRPPFSAQPSRPATPESSDTEATAATGATTTASAAVAHSARTAKAVPRASPKVPTYEYYGFVLHLTSSFAFGIYILWSYLPAHFLHKFGVYYYPNRWWSLAFPAWIVMLLCYIYVALAFYNTGWLTLGMEQIENLTDEKARVAIVDAEGNIVTGKSRRSGKAKDRHQSGSSVKHRPKRSETTPLTRALPWKNLWDVSTDAVLDVPIGGVCEILYGAEAEASDDGV